jgi:hypothetical protein
MKIDGYMIVVILLLFVIFILIILMLLLNFIKNKNDINFTKLVTPNSVESPTEQFLHDDAKVEQQNEAVQEDRSANGQLNLYQEDDMYCRRCDREKGCSKDGPKCQDIYKIS